MRKGSNGGKKTGIKKRGKKEEKTDENSGHYFIASGRPPVRPTAGTHHARANCCFSEVVIEGHQ